MNRGKIDRKYNYRCKPLKRMAEGSEMPNDFWNYNVNPLVGFYVEPQRDEHGGTIAKKYAHLQQPDPKNTA